DFLVLSCLPPGRPKASSSAGGSAGSSPCHSAADDLPTSARDVPAPPRTQVLGGGGGGSPPLALLPAPRPWRPPPPEDVMQVSSVCGVEEALARKALLRSGNSLERAVELLLERPFELHSPPRSSPRNSDAARSDFASVQPPSTRDSIDLNPDDVAAAEASLAAGDETAAEHAAAEEQRRLGNQESAADQMAQLQAGLGGAIAAIGSAGPSAGTELSPEQRKLVEAVAVANVKQAEEAIAGGADAAHGAGTDASLLHAALRTAYGGRLLERHAAVVRLLLRSRADPAATDSQGRALGHRLAELGAEEMLAELHGDGALDLQGRDASGQTPLHKCAAAGRAGATALLLSWGADRDAKDASGATPADVAGGAGAEETLDELLGRPRLLQLAHRLQAAPAGGPEAGAQAAEGQEAASGPAARALAAKEEGNALLKAGNFPAAIEQYTLGIALADAEDRALAADCYNNRAAAHMQLRNYENVVQDATECLQRSPGSAKALVRRAQAYQQLEKFKVALVDTTTAMKSGLLTPAFEKTARIVHKEVREALLADGINPDLICGDVSLPAIRAGVSNQFTSRYAFPARSGVLAVPRSRTLSGVELAGAPRPRWPGSTSRAAPTRPRPGVSSCARWAGTRRTKVPTFPATSSRLSCLGAARWPCIGRSRPCPLPCWAPPRQSCTPAWRRPAARRAGELPWTPALTRRSGRGL
ncbi:unnamed protein product, partial [Prorocentrum cordatum]